ncbi:ABC transporter permease [Corynebacterium sp. 335C]
MSTRTTGTAATAVDGDRSPAGADGTGRGTTGRAGSPVAIVAAREFRATMMRKSTIITLVLMLASVVGGIFAVQAFGGGDGGPDTEDVAVVGDAGFLAPVAPDAPGADALPLTVDARPAADAAEARALVESGDVHAALVPGDGSSWTMIVEGAPDPALTSVIGELLQGSARDAALADAGVDPAAIARAAAGATLDVESIEAVNVGGIIVAMIGSVVIITLIMMFGGMIAMSVVEEKSSRVVEIMLATVRPLHLLAGKILGAGAAGMVFAVAIVGTAAAALAATGVGRDLDLPPGTVLWLLPFFVAAYLFFGSLYAAAASLVSRMEDFQGAQWPVMLLSMLTIYVPAFGWSRTDSTLMRVFAWIPPTSTTAAPLQYAAGEMGDLQMLGALALLLVAAAIVTWLASIIYPRNILRTGAKVRWRDALRR